MGRRDNCLTEIWSGSEEGSYLRLVVPLNSRLESDEETKEVEGSRVTAARAACSKLATAFET